MKVKIGNGVKVNTRLPIYINNKPQFTEDEYSLLDGSSSSDDISKFQTWANTQTWPLKLVVDGINGPMTTLAWNTLASQYMAANNATGLDDVTKFQTWANTQTWTPKLTVDGVWGPMTSAAWDAVGSKYAVANPTAVAPKPVSAPTPAPASAPAGKPNATTAAPQSAKNEAHTVAKEIKGMDTMTKVILGVVTLVIVGTGITLFIKHKKK